MTDFDRVTDVLFERCQHGEHLNASPGEAGWGIYAYPAGMSKMRAYYSAQGETIYHLKMKDDALIVDLTTPRMIEAVIRYARAEMAPDTFGGRPVRLTADTLHRQAWTIESFIAAKIPQADGWLTLHKGPGLPTGRQVVIKNLEAFEVSEAKPSVEIGQP